VAFGALQLTESAAGLKHRHVCDRCLKKKTCKLTGSSSRAGKPSCPQPWGRYLQPLTGIQQAGLKHVVCYSQAHLHTLRQKLQLTESGNRTETMPDPANRSHMKRTCSWLNPAAGLKQLTPVVCFHELTQLAESHSGLKHFRVESPLKQKGGLQLAESGNRD